MNPSAQPRKILVRGVNWLGDAVMSMPALQRLREARPRDSIAVLTDAKLADIWKRHPAVDQVITFEKGESFLAVSRRLQREEFDLSIVLPNSFRSALECFLARVPIRIGYAGNARRCLLSNPVPRRALAVRMRKRPASEVRGLISQPSVSQHSFPPQAHHIYDYLELARQAGASFEPLSPRIAVSKAEIEAFSQKLGLPRHSACVGLIAGAEYGPAKRWPAEYFVKAASGMARHEKVAFLIFGGAGDREISGQIAAGISATRSASVVDLAGKTSLADLCVGLARCSIVVANDTGPMHVAAAVGSRVVALFGSTSPQLTAPGLPGDATHRILYRGVPCSPCFRRECPIDLRCLGGLAPEAVVEAAASNLIQPEVPGS